MKVDVESISPVQKKLVIGVSVAEVKKERKALVRDYTARAKIRGFRPGKAPRDVIERYYGELIERDLLSNVVQSTLPQALEESGLRPVSEPGIDELPQHSDEGMTYSVTFEVKPELGELVTDGVHVTARAGSVEQSQLDEELDYLRHQHASYEPIDDRGADIGDVISLQFEAVHDGATVLGPTSSAMEVGQGLVLHAVGLPVPGVDDEVVGMRASEEKRFVVDLPGDFRVSHLAGKSVEVQITVDDVKRKVLPELDDDFAKDLGEHESLDSLKDTIRERLTKAEEARQKREIEKELVDLLLEKNPFDVPPSLVAKQTEHLRRQREIGLMIQGIDPRSNPDAAAQIEEGLEADATTQVKRFLLLEAAADAGEIEISDEMVEEKLQEMAETSGQNVAKLRARYHEGSERNSLVFSLRQDAALAQLLEKALAGANAADSAAEKPAAADDSPAGGDDSSAENRDAS